MNFRDIAMIYREHNWSVIPLQARGKRPIIRWEPYQTRLAAPEQVMEWWTRWPGANIGIATGAISGIVVLDVDGQEGIETLAEHGLPVTPMSHTGKGAHFIFKHPGGEIRNFARRAPGLDLRGDGGYIVAPPSIHPSGSAYRWEVRPGDVEPAEIPDWLMELIRADPQQLAEEWIIHQATRPRRRARHTGYYARYAEAAMSGELGDLAHTAPGSRNHRLNTAAFNLGQLVASGVLDQTDVELALGTTAQAIGLTQRETRDTLRSGLTAGMQRPRQLR
jgi:putative DNA primase/helicase